MHGRDRIIPLHRKILPYIRKKYNPKNKYLITDENGNPYSYYQYKKYVWEPALQELGIIDKTPHTTRHTLATKLDEVEENKLVIKRLLGHSTQDITARYTKTTMEQLLNCIDKVDW